jgi:AcrR family transcriptional regulator
MTRSRGQLRTSGAASAQASVSTRDRIIAAAVETLRDEGFAGTSARSIARHGDFNQALIFYHFGGVLDLLIAVLETVSSERLAQYRAAIAEVTDLRAALGTARKQYETDVTEGYITVLVELVAGASSAPQLGPEIVRCMEPWIEFAEESITHFLGTTPLAAIIPAREAAHALLAIYLGMEMLDHLDPEADTAGPLFLVAERMLAAVEPFLGLGRRPVGTQSSRRLQHVILEGGPDPARSPRAGRNSPKAGRRRGDP